PGFKAPSCFWSLTWSDMVLLAKAAAHSDQPWCADFSGHVPASAHRSADLGAGPTKGENMVNSPTLTVANTSKKVTSEHTEVTEDLAATPELVGVSNEGDE
ncbi:hypothetical protein THAOC_24475, partial [Thalassiosira oceanica]